MLKQLRKRTEGFTIIEVMIVLAIAGLILLIVFLAVPALQRNSRNTGRKTDIGRVGAAASEFSSNNNGRAPAASAANVAGDAKVIATSVGTMGQYGDMSASANFTVVPQAGPGGAGTTTITNPGHIRIVTSARCNTTVSGQVIAGTSPREIAIQYATETSGSATVGPAVCQEV